MQMVTAVHCTGLMAILNKGFKQLCFSELLGERGLYLFFCYCLIPAASAFLLYLLRSVIYCALFISSHGHFSGMQLAGTTSCGSCSLLFFLSPSLPNRFFWSETRAGVADLSRLSLFLLCIHLNENKELLFFSDLGRQVLMLFLRTGLKIYRYC